MNLILHITQKKQWEKAQHEGIYHADSLETEGFIHCSTSQQIIKVANTFFPHQKDLVLLSIDSEKVHPEIRYETVAENEQFPHIYGELNLDAVVKILDFEPNRDGLFTLPTDL